MISYAESGLPNSSVGVDVDSDFMLILMWMSSVFDVLAPPSRPSPHPSYLIPHPE